MNTNDPTAPATRVSLMSGDDYRESLRQYTPKVFVDGREVTSVVDESAFRPGVNALAYTYDYALRPELEPIALATQTSRNRIVSRILPVHESSGDLLTQLETIRLLFWDTSHPTPQPAHTPS